MGCRLMAHLVEKDVPFLMVSEFGTEDNVCNLLSFGFVGNEVAPTVSKKRGVNRNSGQRAVEVFGVVPSMSVHPVQVECDFVQVLSLSVMFMLVM